MLTTRRKFPLIERSCRRGAAVRLDEIRRSTDVREIWPELENVRQVRVLSKCSKLIVEGEERRKVVDDDDVVSIIMIIMIIVRWRPQSRRFIVLATDRDFHWALDGRLAGFECA